MKSKISKVIEVIIFVVLIIMLLTSLAYQSQIITIISLGCLVVFMVVIMFCEVMR